MAASFAFIIFFTRALSSVCGHQLRGPADLDIPEPPEVGAVTHDGQMERAQYKISALKVRTDYAANTAQAAASQTATQKLKVEEAYIKTMNVMPELDAIKKASVDQAAQATEASKQSTELLKTIEKEKKDIVEKSKLLAVQTVKGMLKNSYNRLSSWRNNVLSNPWEVSQRAAAKAAAPYYKSMGQFGAAIQGYNLDSSLMRSQSVQDAANAKSLAAGAVQKRDANDRIGAFQDEAMADALSRQSDQLAARATTEEQQASDMRYKIMPVYTQHAQLAAWNAEFATNPDSVPPPPVDPNFAYKAPR